ncbi:BTB/POZ domain-containing protein KCTD21-like [Diadema antillarum]|uniref:BTB/POZ domain-containing protein KCTD21-like n=1 Tax=Diadema antillarum TaxID=105358 RepID=UPI003A85675B
MDDFVNINVGGTIYTASRATLCRFPDSMLGSMFSDRLPSTRDEKGNYLIDGDGPLFRHVLNFLRRSALVLPEDFKELDMLAQEADYYQINELIDAVTQLRNEKEEAEKRQEFLEY